MKSSIKLVCLCILTLFFSADAKAVSRYIVLLESNPQILNHTLKPDMSNRDEIIRSLKHDSAQAIEFFAMNTNGKDMRIIREYWSINAVLVETDERNAELLATLPGVDAIARDCLAELEPPVQTDTKGLPENGEEYTYGLTNLNVPKVWNQFGIRGQGVVVGVIDTGITYEHPEWKGQGKIIDYWNVGDPVPGHPGLGLHVFERSGPMNFQDAVDTNGHGTHVAGTIAGGNLSGRHIGVAPETQLIIARGIAGWWTSDLLGAMEYMLSPAVGVFPRVVNSSWTSGGAATAPFYKMMDRWIQLGIFPVFSAGNSGPRPSSITRPKEYPLSFAVGALDKNNVIANFSSRGPALFDGMEIEKPDVCAPGVDVYSASRVAGQYTTMSGTSMASPHVAGVAALVLSARPSTNVDELREILLNAAHDDGEPGYDTAYGHGRLDAYLAVSLALKKSHLEDMKPEVSAILDKLHSLEDMYFENEKSKAKYTGYYEDILADYIFRNTPAEDARSILQDEDIQVAPIQEALINLSR